MRTRKTAVEQLRWQLLFALSGVGAVMASCAGRSEQTINEQDKTGGSAGRPGSGGQGGSTGGTGGTVGGTGGSVGGSTTGAGATGGFPDGGVFSGGVGGVAGTTGGTNVGGEGGAAPDPVCIPLSAGQPGLCKGGWVHREAPAACMLSAHTGAAGQGGEPGIGGSGGAVISSCASDDDCIEAPDGFCVFEEMQPGPPAATCLYACASDAECGSGSVCTCDNSFISYPGMTNLAVGRCVSAGCTTDADCGQGLLCIATVDADCGPARASAFHCQSPTDQCRGPDDCKPTDYCAYRVFDDGTHRFECMARAICGRPFLIDGLRRESELVAGCEWHDQPIACAPVTDLSPDVREAIAAHFAEAALMEHASIAAFARFSLQLMALGAPPELLRDATQAMADETRHAELCFGLATRFGEQAVAPGPLDVTGALGAVTLREVVELVVAEGCVGETAAALEAAWAAEAATDPVVRDVLARIAEDEARHAALAFKFVSWAAARDEGVLGIVERCVAQALAAEPALEHARADEPSELTAHGVLPLAARRAARLATLRDVLPSLVAAVRPKQRFIDVEGCEGLSLA